MNTPELRRIVDDATPVIEKAVARHIVYGAYPLDLQLRGSVCGLASSLLARYLEQKHGIVTDRHIAALDGHPTDDHVQMRHVVLTEQATGAMIDPSFSQFFNLVGLTQATVREIPELQSLYPINKVAVIDAGDERLFGYRYAEYAMNIAPRVRRHLGVRAVMPIHPTGVLLSAGADVIHAVYDGIWERGRYRSYPEQRDDAYIEQMLDESLRLAE
jgi:hypothetical protein